MSKIRALPDLIIRQIAAGEVIERPASALKEMVENALDAGARNIDIHVTNAGKTLLQVRDDGHGMSEIELPMALAKHATSKLSNDDLSDIDSYGFRGEALASIASVAKLHIQSRVEDADTAFEISSENGQMTSPRPCGGNFGTTITVRDLFHATPARLKFLRSDLSEMGAITKNLRHLALCAPMVTFRLFDDDKLKHQFIADQQDLSLAPLDLMYPRIAEIFDQEFIDKAFQLQHKHAPFSIIGLVGPAALHRGRDDRQFLVVNGRVIRDRTMMGTVRASFGDLIPKGRYPVFVLFITCESAWLDVNVHPAKTEVRFREPSLLRSVLFNGIRALLDENAMLTAPTSIDGFSTETLGQQRTFQNRSFQNHRNDQSLLRASETMQQPDFNQDWQPSAYQEIEPEQEIAPDSFPLGAAKAHLMGNYIVAENADGLVLIDQHAAHERIVYEKLKTANRDSPSVQPLLVPEVLHIAPEDIPLLTEASPALKMLGFAFDVFGNDAIVLRSVPALLAESNKAELLQDILKSIADGSDSLGLQERIEAILSRIACHGSIRSGRRLKLEEMNALLRQIEITPNAGHCNHGRPTQIFLSHQDIEKLFGRRG